MRLCIECRHHKPNPSNADWDRCGSPDVVILDLVRGQHKHPYAETTRGISGRCGPSGQLFDYDPGVSTTSEEDFDVV